MEGLPLLPGYSFSDSTRTKHNVQHNFDWKNGYPYIKAPESGIGGSPLDVQSVLYARGLDSVRYDPSLTYGRTKPYVPKKHKPHFVLYDKKCLTFKAFFHQAVPFSQDEDFRIRIVNLVYFLEDDTITVMEPPVLNAGFPQGRLVTRTKVPKDDCGWFYHWKDLNVGMDIFIYGIKYSLCSCDSYTREFLMSQGVDVNPDKETPEDPYSVGRRLKYEIKDKKTPTIEDKTYKFLTFDKKVLRFYAVWDDRDSPFGRLGKYKIMYFLSDDTMQIVEELEPNSGKESYPVLLSRRKVPKNWTSLSSSKYKYLYSKYTFVPDNFPSICMEINEGDYQNSCYSPKDLLVGATIFVFGRRFLLYDCDQFTRNFYRNTFRLEQSNRISIEDNQPNMTQKELPAYIPPGTVEDTLQSFSFQPKAPKKDVIRYLNNMSKKLRYTAVMDWIHPEDQIRQFVIEYRLSDGCMAIQELKVQNSGFSGGTFLDFTLVPKPKTDQNNPEYYTPKDLILNSAVTCFGHRFKITGVDLTVFRYMEANPDKFTSEMIYDARRHLVREGHMREDVTDCSDYRMREDIAEPVVPTYDKDLKPIKARELNFREPPQCAALSVT